MSYIVESEFFNLDLRFYIIKNKFKKVDITENNRDHMM